MPICSTTLAMPNLRYTGSSVASGKMKRAAVPVVFATTVRPPPRSAPAQSRVIELLPRMPLTSTRCGILSQVAVVVALLDHAGDEQGEAAQAEDRVQVIHRSDLLAACFGFRGSTAV